MSKLLMEALEKVDSKILTESTKTMILEAFENAVNEKAEAKMKEQIDSITEATESFTKKIVESHVMDLNEKFNKAVEEKAKELNDDFAKKLQESTNEKYEKELEEIQENIRKYTKVVVEKFVEENKSTWEDEVSVHKANAIMESAVTFAKDFGIELQNVSMDENEAKVALDESLDKNEQLQKQVDQLTREKLISEASRGMTVPQIEKLDKLMEGFSVSDVEKFKENLELFKSTLVEKVEKKPETSENSEKPSWES